MPDRPERTTVPMRRRSALAAAAMAALLVLPADVSATQAEEARPTHSFVGNYLAGRFAAQQRDKDAADTFLGAALEQSPGDVPLLDQAFVAALSAGNYGAAVERAQDLVKVDPENRLARITLAADALRGRQYVQVTRAYEEGFENPLAQITGAFLAAWAHAAQRNNDEARNLVDRLDDLSNADIRRIKDYVLGMLAEYSGDNEAALSAYTRAQEVARGNVRLAEAVIRANARLGNFDEALKIAQEYADLAPGQPVIAAALAAVEKERVPAFPATSPQAGAAEAVFTIGAALGQQPSDEMAVMFYQMALLLKPDADMPLMGLAGYYDAVEDHASAIETLDRIPASSPQAITAQISKARVLDDLERTDEAMEILDALEIAAPGREVFLARASILHNKKRYTDAAQAYSRAIDLIDEPKSGDWYLYYYRGMVQERAKQWPRAERDFKQALKLNPEQPNVLNYLGYSWIDQGMNLEEALKLVRRAVELRPKDGDIVDSLGWAYYKLGRYEEAVKTLERAVELRPEEPVIQDHLGDAYWKVGRRIEAAFQWRHALDLKPEDEELVETIKKKLENGLPDEPVEKQAQVTE